MPPLPLHTGEKTRYGYELHQLNYAELIRRDEEERAARRVALARRAARRAERHDTEGRAGKNRSWFVRTAREQEMHRPVAAGYTSRRIAEELCVSPKTASVHVSDILAKLSVSSRGGAAALAHRFRLYPVG